MSGFQQPDSFDYTNSTEKNYSISKEQVASRGLDEELYVGKHVPERKMMDYTYHTHYTTDRQLFHDDMIDLFHDTVVHDTDHNVTCDKPLHNWLVFTAGPMGAGKGHTMHWLAQQGLFPLNAFVRVDPDTMRELLPETKGYISRDPHTAGFLTQKEVGYVAEILSMDALNKGKNVLVDGSLRNAEWYSEYISQLRAKFPAMKFAIIHVTAEEETVLARAEKRAQETGRHVPKEVLLETMEQIPVSLKVLSPSVDYIATFQNEDDTSEPVLLWSSRKMTRSGSSAQLADLALLDADVQEEMAQHRITYNRIAEKGEQALSPRRTSLSFSADELDELVNAKEKETEVGGSGVKGKIKGDGGFKNKAGAVDTVQPHDDWKDGFRNTWKMRCAPER